MPTVLRQDGLIFIIYPSAHDPPHVHIFKGGEQLVLLLGDEDTGPSIRDNFGMSASNARKAVKMTEQFQNLLLEAWRRQHGT